MKILYIGNETADTDLRVTDLAKKDSTVNHGLISSTTQDISLEGYYHTSVTDLPAGDIAHMAPKFDCVKLLDQPKDSYPHYKSLVTSLRLMYDLDVDNLVAVEYADNLNARDF